MIEYIILISQKVHDKNGDKRVMKKIIYILITALLFVGGCSKKEKKFLPFSSSSGDTTQNFSLTGGGSLTEIRVTPTNAQIAQGTYGVFKAEGYYSNGP